MLISLRTDHKEHLQLLTTQTEQDFCKLASDYLQNGPNTKLYSSAASKLDVSVDVIQNCVYGITNLLLLACKHQLNEADFRDSLRTIGFSEEQVAVLNNFYNSKKLEVTNILKTESLVEPHYHDLQWRFEVQLATRSLPQQVTPLIAMDLSLKKQKNDGSEPQITHHLLQTDPTNLMHLAKELENVLNESRNRHSRKVQRVLSHLHQ